MVDDDAPVWPFSTQHDEPGTLLDGRLYNEWAVCGGDERDVGKARTQELEQSPLPERVKMEVDFIDEYDSGFR